MRNVLRVAFAAALLGAGSWVVAGPAHAAPIPTDLATSLHGAVETQAITIGNGAAALLVDPGTGYAYTSFDRDDYGNGSGSFTMTARAANLNLGTIPYAVIWAAPSCDKASDPNAPNAACVLSGGLVPGVTPNTGLHEAKGFPAYAEALYPAPPEDSGDAAQDHVYKCVINKDGPGAQPSKGQMASVCKTSDAIPLTAWAEAVGPEYRATDFSRAAGFDTGLLKVAGSESWSQIHPIAGGKLISEGYSVAHNISVLGGQVTIDAVRSEARIVSDANGNATRSGGCTFAGLKIEGQAISSNGSELPYDQVSPLLQQIADNSGYVVQLIPPTPVVSSIVEGSQQFVSCSGLQIKITDSHTQSPVPVCLPVQVDPSVPQCVPALANREEFSFGRITVQQSVNNNNVSGLDSGAGGGGAGLTSGSDTGGGGSADVLGADLSATGAPGSDLGAGAGVGSSGVNAQAGAGALNNGSPSIGTNGLENAAHRMNSARLGVLAAVSSLAWLIAILVLVGVVNSLATGRSLRLPGF